MKLLKIAFSNIRKRKSNAITLFAIVSMASLMLSISLSLILNVGSFYDRKREELNTPHFTIAVQENAWQDLMPEYAQNYPGVREAEFTQGYMADIKYKLHDTYVKQQLFVYDDNIQNTMNTFTIIDKLSVKPVNSIILTLNFKYNGFKAGDKFSFKCADSTYEFIIYGFFEDAQIGGSTTSIKGVYVNANAYELIGNSPAFMLVKNISLNFDKLETSYNFQSDFLKQFNLSSSASFSATYQNTKMSATMFPLIMSMVLILIAVIVINIALIIVRFTIKNNIEEDIKTLGALKSIGYTSNQIIFSILFQFLFIALTGSVAGFLLSLLATGYVGNVVSATSGLLWSSVSFFIPAVISVLAITGIVALVTYLVAKRAKTVTPINALRTGLGNHNFKKNYVSLEKTRLPLNMALAAKNFFGTIKNNITAFIVLILFAFTSVLGFSLYQNFVVDTSAFITMIGAEPANIQLASRYENLTAEIFSEIKNREGVVKTIVFDSFSTTSDNKLLGIYVWDDITLKEASNVIKGRYPVHDNEITLTSAMQKTLNKNIGDIVNIEYEGVTQSYIVTGITQGVGEVYTDMTKEGFQRLAQDFTLKIMYIFLDNSDGAYIDDFIDSLIIDYGNQIAAVNFTEAINNSLVALKDPIAVVTYLVTAITMFTVCFVFFLMINTIIRRRKKDMGIMKAMGFTSGQLILQILLSFLPVIVLGTIIGTIAGIFLTNPLLGLMFSGIGIAKPLFMISIPVTAIAEFILMAVCVVTTYLVSLKSKNISPQKLITEQ